MNMNVFKKIGSLMRKTNAVAKETTQTGVVQESITQHIPVIQVSSERKKIITDCQAMWRDREQNAAAIQTISSFLTMGGFTVRVKPKEKKISMEEQKAQELINAVILKTRLQQHLKGWMTAFPRDGGIAIEVEVGQTGIERLTKLPLQMTIQRTDKRGKKYEDGGDVDILNAYYQVDTLTGQEICQLADWQVMWIGYNAIQGEDGTPQFISARKTHKQLTSSEDDMFINRKVNAGQHLHHKIGTSEKPGTAEAIIKYKRDNKDSINNPLRVASHFFSDESVDIKPIPSDSNIGNIIDVKYQASRYLGAGGVPCSMIPGQEPSIIKDSSKESKNAFLARIIDMNEAVGLAMKKSIFDLELLLNGINPDGINYSVVWGAKENVDEIAKREQVIKAKAAGIYSVRTAMAEYGIADIDAEIERIKQDMDDFPQVPVERVSGYAVGNNPMGLVGSLKMGQGLRENRLMLEYLTTLREVKKSYGR
ncbi:MAG: hypothetical protein QME49_04795 [bacterium]|nr:hypothetical protein [bacterium]